MSITLSIPPAVVHEARAFAESQGTSLNAMIRDFLSHVATGDLRRREAANSFREVAAMVRKRRKAGSGYRFNRADAYDRGGRRMTFLDSNIAVYAVDSHDPRKQEIAARLIDEAVGGEGYRISAQVFLSLPTSARRNWIASRRRC